MNIRGPIIRLNDPAAPLQPIGSRLNFQNDISCVPNYRGAPWPENAVHLDQYVKGATPADRCQNGAQLQYLPALDWCFLMFRQSLRLTKLKEQIEGVLGQTVLYVQVEF